MHVTGILLQCVIQTIGIHDSLFNLNLHTTLQQWLKSCFLCCVNSEKSRDSLLIKSNSATVISNVKLSSSFDASTMKKSVSDVTYLALSLIHI